MGLMVFLASGEDPNFGVYSSNVRLRQRAALSQAKMVIRATSATACTTTAPSPCSLWPRLTGAVDDRQVLAR